MLNEIIKSDLKGREVGYKKWFSILIILINN